MERFESGLVTAALRSPRLCYLLLVSAPVISRRRMHVELENAWDHDHGLRPVPVLEHREFHRFGAVHEQATTKAALILDDPVAAAVPADSEQGFRTAGRGRLTFAHGNSPFDNRIASG